MKIRNVWTGSILFVILTLGSIASTAYGLHDKTTGASSVSVTGCLQKGDEAGEYSITGKDGKRYGLRSKTVDLSKHLGHTVTVTGTKEREENEEKEKNEGRGEYADLLVTDLKMVSSSCQ